MVERILDLMKKKGINAAALSREISLTNGLVTQWKQGKQKPSTDAIIKLASFFNVTTDYLLLGEEKTTSRPLKEINSNLLINNDLSEDELELIKIYRKLDNRGRHVIHATSYDELDRVNGVKSLNDLDHDVG